MSNYYKLSADAIYSDTALIEKKRLATILGEKIIILPHVYPSDKFRSTFFCLKNIKSIVKNKKVCDMGCGPGTMGILSLKYGAQSVIHADINPYAIENVKENKKFHQFSDQQSIAYESDCFDNIPKQVFDIIIFPIPFHDDEIKIQDPLQLSYFDPNFKSLKKFLSQVDDYSHSKTEIIFCFSNKGNVNELEHIFDSFHLRWDLWKITNKSALYDTRLYRVRF